MMRGFLTSASPGRAASAKAKRSSAAATASSRSASKVLSSCRLRTSASRGGEDGGGGTWTDETPDGSSTELYVYRANSFLSRFPDQSLGVFAAVDARVNLPGNVGLADLGEGRGEEADAAANQEGDQDGLGYMKSDVLSRPTNLENQAQTLYTAHDFIQHTPGSDAVVCADLLEELPAMTASDALRVEVHEAPMLIKKEAKGLFPDNNLGSTSNLSILTLSRRTENDMSAWSDQMEEERDRLEGQFVAAAKEICARLATEGFWADFIDPGSGTPFFARHSAATMFETDEKYRLLGFRVEDLGCCKVICHRDFGRKVFVGSIFTNAHASNPVVEDVLAELKLSQSRQGEETTTTTTTQLTS